MNTLLQTKKDKNNYWQTLSPLWQACLEEAWEAYCCDCVPVGAVVTDSEGLILARGRNRIGERQGEAGLLFGQALAHAEVNALARLTNEVVDRHAYTLYTTLEPCPLCLGAFYMSGVRRLCFAARDPYAGSIDLLGATPYLSRKPVQAFGPERPELETMIAAIITEHVLRRGLNENWRVFLEIWAGVLPQAVRLGEALFKSGELDRMRERPATAGQMLNRLVELLS